MSIINDIFKHLFDSCQEKIDFMQDKNQDIIEKFLRGNIQAIGFTALDETEDMLFEGSGEFDYDVWEEIKDHLSKDEINEIFQDSVSFIQENEKIITDDNAEQAGSDFHLTRNRHGCGYWDGDWEDEIGKILTDSCKPYGSQSLYGTKNADGEIASVFICH